MFSQFSPKERALYAIFVSALLFGFGFVGMRHLQSNPDLKLEPAKNVKAVGMVEGPKPVLVHVVGAVKNPGVVRMDSECRVQDAIRECGGAKEGAMLEEINLAAKLVDGTQLIVPGRALVAQKPATLSKVAPAYRGKVSNVYAVKPAPTAKIAPKASGPVSLNDADSSDLVRLPGVGPATAAKILQYRQSHGGFSSVEELLAVKGIGPKKLAAMRKHLKL